MTNITRNAARCLVCGTVVESKHRHDFVWCECGNLFVDGGHDYLRRGINDTSGTTYEELSEYGKYGTYGNMEE